MGVREDRQVADESAIHLIAVLAPTPNCTAARRADKPPFSTASTSIWN